MMHPVKTPAVRHPVRSVRPINIGTTTTLPLTQADLERWFASAEPGSTVVYHRGILPLDRCAGSRLGEDAGQELDRVAAAVMAMAEAGHVHLVQRRHGAGDYSYMVVASSGGRGHPGGRAGRRIRETAR